MLWRVTWADGFYADLAADNFTMAAERVTTAAALLGRPLDAEVVKVEKLMRESVRPIPSYLDADSRGCDRLARTLPKRNL